jgi:RHS repeat-associated protein
MRHKGQRCVARLLVLTFLASLLQPFTFRPAVAEAKRPDRGTPPGQAESKRNDRPVEVPQRRTPTSKTFRNPDGTLSTELYAKPIHYRDESGQYQLIQNTFVAEPGGQTVKNAANRYKAAFKNQLGADFLNFTFRGRSMAMDLEGARPQRASWHSGKLSYAEALENVDLVYTLGNDFVKEEIVLKAPMAAPQWTFNLKLKGVALDASDPMGVLHFRNEATDEVIWSIPRMFMRDTAGALSGAVAVEARQTGNRIRLTVTPDEAWLNAPERAYPVVIDPTVALQPDYMGGLDTTIADGEGLQDINLGFDSALAAGTGYASLLKFDLTAIPRASIIDKATLTLHNISAPPTVNSTGVPAPTAAPTLSVSTYTSAFTAGTYSVLYTYVTPQGETLASPHGTVTIGNFQGIDVNAGPLPAGVTGIHVYMGAPGSERLAVASDLPEVTLTSKPAADAASVPLAPEKDPVLGVSAVSGSIPAGTYSVVYTYETTKGETTASPAETITLSATKAIDVNVGPFPPGVTKAKLYLGVVNDERLVTTTTSPTYTFKSLPSSSQPRPPAPRASYTTAPAAAPTATAVAAASGKPGFMAGTYYVRYTWLNSMGETTVSPATAVTLTDGQTLSVKVGKMPVGVNSANIYVGSSADDLQKIGNIMASAKDTPVTFGAPPASLFTPGPAQILSIISTPTTAPTLQKFTNKTAFVEGDYAVVYTFFGPNGETAPSPASSIRLAAGDHIKVTAGQALPDDATGMRVYLGNTGGPLYLAGTLGAARTDSTFPWLEVKAPPGYKAAQPVTSSTNPAPYGTPTLKAVDLNTKTILEGATYYVAYSWVYPAEETPISGTSSVTIKDGQAIEVAATTLPTGAVGMRVYMGRVWTNLSLVATSMGRRTVVEGDRFTPTAPQANGTEPIAPVAEAVSLSALPAGTYYLAYTLTNETSESAPSPVASTTITAGRKLSVTLPSLPAGHGANVYIGRAANNLQLVRGSTSRNIEVTALPGADATPLSTAGRGAEPPATPTSKPLVGQLSTSSLPAGTELSVKYVPRGPGVQYKPSLPARLTLGSGQAIAVRLPDYIPGIQAMDLYVGYPGQEKLVSGGHLLGASVQVTSFSASSPALPVDGVDMPAAPKVASATGGTLSGDVYFSYSFVSEWGGSETESARSPEVLRTFSGTSATAVLTTATVPYGVSQVRVYAGTAPGEGRLYGTFPATAGAVKSVSVTRTVPAGIALHPVSTPWTELDATWIRSNANALWYDRGGDYSAEIGTVVQRHGQTLSTDLTSLVRKWADGTAPNQGVLLKGAGAKVEYASSDHPDESLRPVLTVTYREKKGPPRVRLTAPAAGSSVSGNVTLSAHVSTPDPGTAIDRVDFYVSGAHVGTDTVAPYTVTWNTANLPGGLHEVTAKAYDQFGQEGTSGWTMVLGDPFDNSKGADFPFTNTKYDAARGIMTLSTYTTTPAIVSVGASSEKAAESYPAENLIDDKNDTYWRSPGQITPDSYETIRFDMTYPQSYLNLTVRPRNEKDGLTVKAQAVDSNGDMIKESDLVVLDSASKTLYLSASRSFSSVRLVFGNLKRDLASGRYHAEVAEVSDNYFKPALAEGESYRATYEARNATDGSPFTSWVSSGKGSPTVQEYLELSLSEPANAFYIKPRTPGVSAMIATYQGAEEGWAPTLTIAALDEGLYPLPPGVAADKVRIYLTNLMGMTGPGAPDGYFGGLDEVVPYDLELSQSLGTMQTKLLTLPANAGRFLLETEDSQPPGSSIQYHLYDGVTWHPITPGVELTLPVATGMVILKATLTSGSPTAVPVLSGWRLYSYSAHPFTLVTGTDTIPPTAELVYPASDWISGNVSLDVATWDNVGVTKVELFVDSAVAPAVTATKAPGDTTPYVLSLDTTKLVPGPHMMWVKAYDAAGNVSGALPPTTTYKAFTDSFGTYDNIDLDLSTHPVSYGGSLVAGTPETAFELTGSGALTRSFEAGRGLITASAPSVSEASGVCASGYVQLQWNYSVVASDQIMDGECREVRLTYMATEPGTYTIRFSQDSTQQYKATVNHPGKLSAAYPYTFSTAISAPTVAAGPLKSLNLTVAERKPAGTSIRYWVSANDGVTWQQVTPGTDTQLNHGGRKLRLRADMTPAAASGSTWANFTPEVLDWSAEVTQFIPKNLVTVSQIAPAKKLTASLSNTTATVQWQASTTPGVTYNVYRSTTPHPEGEAYLVAKGVTGTSLTESSNLLKNSSFERGLSGWNTYWYPWYTVDSNESWAGLKALRLYDYGYYDNGVYQDVPVSAAAGTTFTLRTRVKGQNVVETYPQALGITLQYTDYTWSSTTWGSIPGGTFDWTDAHISMTAAKPVRSARVIVRHYGRGNIWFDGVQFDTKGATLWNDGDLEKNKVYYYLVTAVDANGVESAPSNEASTGTVITTAGMLGVKGFWPYSNLPLAGGTGYVNLASGNLAYAATDLVYPGRLLTATFRRTYNSQGAGVTGPLGNGWDHNYNWTLTPAGGGAQVLKEGDGSTFTFTSPDNGLTYTTPPGARMRLIKRADGSHTLVRHDNNLLYEFGANGRPVRIAEPNGNALTLAYNADGTLSRVTDPSGSVLAFTYTGGLLTSVTHPGYTGARVTFKYNDRGNLVQVTDLDEQPLYYGYDENNRLLQVTDALGHSTQLTYSGMPGVVQQIVYPDTTEQTFTYGAVGDDASWKKSTVTDARGFSLTYQVDANGLLKRQSFPYGTATPTGTQTGTASFEHDAAWNVTKYTDPLSRVTTITYDGYGNTLSVTDAAGNRSSNLWVTKPYPEAEAQVLNVAAQQTDALNQTTVFTTDSRGNVTQAQDPLLNVTTYAYDTFGQRTSAKDANRHETTYTYDSHGWLLTQTDPLGGTTRYTYDAGGNPSIITDQAGSQTRCRYDRLGRQTEITYADGSTQFYVYDAAGNVVQSTDPGGATTRYEYDSRNRAVTMQQWPNAGDTATVYTTRYEYDSVGLATAVVDPRGKRSTTTYDGAGRPLTSANPLGDTTTHTYDAAGNVTQIKDPLGTVVTAEYDKLNRRTKTVIPQDYSNKLEQIVAYDALGRMTSQKDALGNTTTYHYDALGRLALVVDPMGLGTTYIYDAVGNRLAVTDAQLRTNQYVYDAANRVIEEKRPDGVSVLTTYDKAGRVIATTNGRNQTIGYRYDNMNRKVETTYPSGANVRYTYDAMGRRTSMTDWNGTTRYHYNLLGWLEQTIDPWGHEVSYQYGPAGNRTRMNLSYAGVDFTWTYEYDDAGRIKSLQAPSVPRPDTFTYDKAGRMEKLTYANGDTITNTFNQAGDLKSISGYNSTEGSFMQFTYYFDKAGRRTSIDRRGSAIADGDVYYKYDAGSRVTSAGPSSSASNREYYYDLVGNRHTMAINSGDAMGVYTYVYDSFNRLLEEAGPVPTSQGGGRYHKSQTYDGEGALTRVEKDGKEVTLYYYDEESRLVQVTDPAGQITRYTYNGDGQRVSMTEARGKTFFIYDGTEVLAEADATGTIKIAYSRTASGRLVSQWQGGETFWYHLDGLSSTIAMTDESGKVRNKYGYDEYGNPTNATSEQIFNRFTFTGQAWDAGVGLYHYKARYYNPQGGRFLTQDSWKGSPWQPWTQNQYTYVGNNPVNLIDPTGHCPICVGAAIGAAWGAISYAAGQVMTGQPITAKGMIVATVGGAIGGALSTVGLGAAGQAIASGALNVAETVATEYWEKGRVTSSNAELAASFVSGAVTGYGQMSKVETKQLGASLKMATDENFEKFAQKTPNLVKNAEKAVTNFHVGELKSAAADWSVGLVSAKAKNDRGYWATQQ